MKTKEILQRIILKAEKNGYCCETKVNYVLFYCEHFCILGSQFFSKEQNYKVNNIDETGNPGEIRRWHSINEIIFSPKFAKAFWGEEKLIISGDCTVDGFKNVKEIEAWKYHLQQIVILSDNEKLKYLEKSL